jgi:2-C-methyl-D-erythritol 4-phosphate cytidylyltransferase
VKFALIMPAAGSGLRLGADRPKALVDLLGKPLFVLSAEPILNFETCVEAVIAAPAGESATFERFSEQYFGAGRMKVVAGGSERQASVANALRALRTDAEVVLVHDAVRPLVTRELAERLLAALNADVAAVIPAVKIPATVKMIDGQPPEVKQTLDRSQLVAVQTPQVLRRRIFAEALKRAEQDGFVATDDAALVERYHLGTVRVVEGEQRNFKITTAYDMAVARFLLEQDIQRAEAARGAV